MSELDTKQIRMLIGEAQKMLACSYVPLSNFNVGAALLAKDGRVFTGCNVELSVLTGSSCAERTAVMKAISEGVREFRAVAIVGGKRGGRSVDCPPCGVCRQTLREFCDVDDFQVIIARSPEEYRIMTLGELLPDSFGPEFL